MEEWEWSETRRLVEFLREEGQLFSYGCYDVALEDLTQQRFACDSQMCLVRQGRKIDLSGACCVDTEVWVSQGERRRIYEKIQGIGRVMPPESGFWREPHLDPFEMNQQYEFHLARNSDESCIFSYLEEGRIRCGIHVYCLQEGIPLLALKPFNCNFWPLSMTPYDGGRYLLALDDNLRPPCLTRPPEGTPILYQTMRNLLVELFGQEFYDALDQAAREYAARKEGDKGTR